MWWFVSLELIVLALVVTLILNIYVSVKNLSWYVIHLIQRSSIKFNISNQDRVCSKLAGVVHVLCHSYISSC